MILFLFASLVLLAGSLPWLAYFRLSNKAAWLTGFYLLGSANVILTLYIANSVFLLNRQWFVLLIHALIGGAGWFVWHRAGRPVLWGPFQGWKFRFDKQSFKKDPVMAMWVIFTALAYVFALVQLIHIPQNNVDSLRVHLARIGFWYQHGSFFPWPALAIDQIIYPVNAQLQTYWTLLFLGNDRLVGLSQWLAALVSALVVFGLARSLGYGFRPSVFAALIFLSFPLIALQSTTTQADLVTMVFFLPSVYFLFLGLKEEQDPFLILSAISVGIGIGVKKPYFLLLPVLAIIAILMLMQFGRRSIKPLGFWAISLVTAILILGSYQYVINWRYFGNIFGSSTYIDDLIETPKFQGSVNNIDTSRSIRAYQTRPEDGFFGEEYFMELVYNVPRVLYQSLDTSGLPRPLDGYAHKVKNRLIAPVFQWIGFEEIEGTAYTAPKHPFSFSEKNINEESNAWYGPLSVLLLFSALILESRRGFKERSCLLLAPGMALLAFLPLEILLRPGWDPYQGRYFAPVFALASPLMARWFSEKKSSFSELLIGSSALLFLFVTLLYNPSKPTLGKYSDEFRVWNNERIFIQTIQAKIDRELYLMIEENVPADAVLGYYIPDFFMEYPLFGETFERRLAPMKLPSQIENAGWLRQYGIEYLLLPRDIAHPEPPTEYQIVSTLRKWILYVYTPTP